MNSICLDGHFMPADQPALFSDNRAYRYGDGVFETMKWVHDTIPLQDYHTDRLWKSLHILKYHLPAHLTKDSLLNAVELLVRKNKHEAGARVRLSFSGGRGGLYDGDGKVSWLIESFPLHAVRDKLNENGLVIGTYPGDKKNTGPFSNLKSASFLLYSMAAIHAKENKWNDAIVLNQYDRVADSTIANVFIIKDNIIYTPSLEEGCVAGVMRRALLEKLPASGFDVIEKTLTPADIKNADEIFLSNAIRGIRWVQSCDEQTYRCDLSAKIYKDIVQTIFSKAC